MNDYTPSTEEVREQFWAASGTRRRDPEAWGEFDRWLAAHDAEVRSGLGQPSNAQVAAALDAYQGQATRVEAMRAALRAAGCVR